MTINRNDIAVIGLACRFPAAADADEFWELLQNGRDAISEIPSNRWHADQYYHCNRDQAGKMVSRFGGFVSDIEYFDAQFFNISQSEARQLDPQQRLLLEVSWRALEHAGYANNALAGSRTGVYIGISTSDNIKQHTGDVANIDAFTGLANAHSIAANRLSYFLDLKGPSLAIDTACSSSLVAVHYACQSLRLKSIDMAIAGGVNVIMNPDLNISFSKSGMLSPDGRCKTFDDSANGYVRSEGCGVVILKRLADAVAENAPILAVIKGTAVNQDGLSNGITAPNRQAQEAVIQEALADAGVTAAEIGLLESHGTGTHLGDPIEFNAVKSVLETPGDNSPCALGAVKSNIGHLEAAAGVAGLIKVVLSMVHDQIPPNLHLNKVNRRIDNSGGRLFFPQTLTPWPGKTGTNKAGVSSFGFGGTNAHVVLAQAAAKPSKQHPVPLTHVDKTNTCHVFTVSAKNEKALLLKLQNWRDFAAGHTDIPPGALCYCANVKQFHFSHRLAWVVDSNAMVARLDEAITEFNDNGYRSKRKYKLRMNLGGQGCQWAIKQLPKSYRDAFETFRSAGMDYAGKLIKKAGKRDVLVNGSAVESKVLDACEAMLSQYFFVRALIALGVKLDTVSGVSVGVFTAGCFAHYLGLAEALVIVVAGQVNLDDIEPEPEPPDCFTEAGFGPLSQPVGYVSTYEGKHLISAAEYFEREIESVNLFTHGDARSPDTPKNEIHIHTENGSIIDGTKTIDSNKDRFVNHLLAAAYEKGCPIDWQAVYADKTPGLLNGLPGYPFQKDYYWIQPCAAKKEALPAVHDETEPVLLQHQWTATPQRSTAQKTAGIYLIVTDSGSDADLLGRLNKPEHSKYRLLVRGERFQRLDKDRFKTTMDSAEIKQIIERFAASASLPIRGLVYLVPDYRTDKSLSAEKIGKKIVTCGLELQNLLKAYLDVEQIQGLPWMIATRRGQKVKTGEWSDPFQNSLWAMAKVLNTELQECEVKLVDVESLHTDLPASLEELGVSDKAPVAEQLAWRDEKQYRFQPIKRQPAPDEKPWRFKDNATYVVSGGNGYIGRKLIHWMVEKGALNIVILSRHEVAPKTVNMAESVWQRGAKILALQCDITKPKDIKKAFKTIDEVMPAVKGVFHLAGRLDDGLIINQTKHKIENALAAKALGGWNLYRQVQAYALDYFVCFSSFASYMGSPGQFSYAAANGFIDGLVTLAGEAGRGINWGPWAGSHMAAAIENGQNPFAGNNGIHLLRESDAWQSLERILAGRQQQHAVARLDWQVFSTLLEPRSEAAGTESKSPPPVAEHTAPALKKIMAADTQRRQQLVRQYLRNVCVENTGMSETELNDEDGLFDLGIDSLMLIGIKTQIEKDLEIDISASSLFSNSSIEKLSAYVMKQINTKPAAVVIPDSMPHPSKHIEYLTDDEAARMVKEKVQSLLDTYGN